MINFSFPSNCDITIIPPSGIPISATNVSSYGFTPSIAGIYQITIKSSYNSSIGTYNIYLEPNSYSANPSITIEVYSSETPLSCDFELIYHPCKNYVTVLYKGIYKPEFGYNFYMYYNNQWIKTNAFTTEIQSDIITTGVKRCETELVEVEGCCGSSVYEYIDINCEERICSFSVEPTNFSYITSFIDCADNNIISVEKSKINNICNGYCYGDSISISRTGYGGCDCNEIKNCKCIPVNYPIKFVVEGFIQSNNCGTENNLFELYVDGDLIDSKIVTNINGITPFQITFTEMGEHIVELHLTDCCGNKCINRHSVIVGGDIFIKTDDCPHTFTFYNYKNTLNIYNQIINIYDINFTKLLSTYVLGGGIENKFTLNGKQGIYLLEYNEVNKNTNQIIYQRYFVIYDICKLYECYLSKVKKSLEKDCEECGDKNMDLSLCEFQVIFDTLKTNLDIILRRSEGYYDATNMRLNEVVNAEYLINKLKFMCDIDLDNEDISNCC